MDDEIQAEPPRGMREEAITSRQPMPKMADGRLPLKSAEKATANRNVVEVIATVMFVCCLSGCLVGQMWSDWVFQIPSSYLAGLKSFPRSVGGAAIGLWAGAALLLYVYKRSLRQDHPFVVIFASLSTGGFLGAAYAFVVDPPWNHEFPSKQTVLTFWSWDLYVVETAGAGAGIGLVTGVVLLLFLRLDAAWDTRTAPKQPPKKIAGGEVVPVSPEHSQAIQEIPTKK